MSTQQSFLDLFCRLNKILMLKMLIGLRYKNGYSWYEIHKSYCFTSCIWPISVFIALKDLSFEWKLVCRLALCCHRWKCCGMNGLDSYIEFWSFFSLSIKVLTGYLTLHSWLKCKIMGYRSTWARIICWYVEKGCMEFPDIHEITSSCYWIRSTQLAGYGNMRIMDSDLLCDVHMSCPEASMLNMSRISRLCRSFISWPKRYANLLLTMSIKYYHQIRFFFVKFC